MSRRTSCTIAALLLFLFGGFLFRPLPVAAALQPVRIGVLAHRGAEIALKMWGPTADYLSANIPQHSFAIVPLGFREIAPAVARGEVDFVLANSSIYVELEASYGVNRIATMETEGLHSRETLFGGVIFCRADRSDLNTLADLQGKSFLAVDETSLGGWQVAWRELKKHGLDPYRDFGRLRFAGSTHDNVVYAVRDGTVDAGTVRTDTLERLAEEGKIDLRIFRVLDLQEEKNFPYLLSTRLYPEWPLAVARHTDGELAKQVAVALFQMPPAGPATKAAKITGWSLPLDYHPVHDLLKELRLGPYKNYGKITLVDVVRLYWYWLVLAITALLVMVALTLHVLRLNKHLVSSKRLLEEARNGLEQKVRVRTEELQVANAELRKSEKYVRKVTAALGEGVYVLDALGNLTFMNPAAENLLGWTEPELLHKNIHNIIHNRRADGSTLLFADCEMRRVIEKGNSFYSAGEVFVKKDGTVFPVAIHTTPLIEDGKIVASVTSFSDISERTRLEKEREKLIVQLQQAVAEIKTLHGIVPICASCKKIRDDEGAWHQLEAYISRHTDARFSHGICKDCAKKLYPEYYDDSKC